MSTLRAVWWLMLIVQLGACAAIERADLARAAQRTHTQALRPMTSEQDLVRVSRASAAFAQAAENRRMRAYCALAVNFDDWKCRELRGDKDDRGLETVEVTGSRIKRSDVITNNQEGGIDEGDIVKKLGDRLIVLHSTRLHVVSLRDAHGEALTQLDSIDVSVEGSGESTWYDEILAVGNQLILLGYNWDEEIAELSVFELSAQGRLQPHGRYWIRVGDYFSESNYGARIQGDNLLLSVSTALAGRQTRWPQLSRRDVPDAQWRALVEPRDLYFPLAVESEPYAHLVLLCPLAALAQADLQCKVTGIVGGESSVFYATADAAYLALPEWDAAAWHDPRFDPDRMYWDEEIAHLWSHRYTAVYRIPYAAGEAIGVARLDGMVEDQFSFKESADGLFAITKSSGADVPPSVRLQRIDPNAFTTSLQSRARVIAELWPSEAQRVFRFSENAAWIGAHSWVLEDSDWTGPTIDVIRQPLDGGAAQTIALPHSCETIELVGDRLLIAGYNAQDAWGMSLLSDVAPARRLSSFALTSYTSAESRSHAFNSARLASGWVFGMPGIKLADVERDNPISDLLLFTLDADQLRQLGVLDMGHDRRCADHCDDWYGNARVFMIGERILALSGSLMKEARVSAGVLDEIRALPLE